MNQNQQSLSKEEVRKMILASQKVLHKASEIEPLAATLSVNNQLSNFQKNCKKLILHKTSPAFFKAILQKAIKTLIL